MEGGQRRGLRFKLILDAYWNIFGGRGTSDMYDIRGTSRVEVRVGDIAKSANPTSPSPKSPLFLPPIPRCTWTQ